LEDRDWEKRKYMLALEERDYTRYLEVCKIIGWNGAKEKTPPPTAPKENAAKEAPNKESPAKETIKKESGRSFCRKCGNPYKPADKFCNICGERAGGYTLKCACGQENAAGSAFCGACGAALK
ncbi:MAG: zinc ribbon domain-containing protein, partial [Clostridiales bacterium]|nr:zinc ribbon domain-containing protein [Clostridiales bacterium]